MARSSSPSTIKTATRGRSARRGLLVWAEIPSWRTFFHNGSMFPDQRDLDDIIKRRVEQTLDAMIRRDYNHPSLIIWTIVNEDWGTLLPLSAADRTWVATMYDRC